MAAQTYILGLANMEIIELQYLPLEGKGNRTANYTTFTPSGRSNPIHHYTGGAETFSIEFSATTVSNDRTDVLSKVQKLLTFACNDGDKIPPQFVKLFLGGIAREERLIITSVGYDYSLFNPAHEFRPDMAMIDITFAFAPEKNLTHNSIRKWQ